MIKTTGLTKENKEHHHTKLKKLADRCLKLFYEGDKNDELEEIRTRKLRFSRAGDLFDNPVFEYGLYSDLINNNYRHTLVWFLCEDTEYGTQEVFNDCYGKLVKIFLFRAKVIDAFSKSLMNIEKIKVEENKLRKKIDNVVIYSKKTIVDELDNFISQIEKSTLNITTRIYLQREMKEKNINNLIEDINETFFAEEEIINNLVKDIDERFFAEEKLTDELINKIETIQTYIKNHTKKTKLPFSRIKVIYKFYKFALCITRSLNSYYYLLQALKRLRNKINDLNDIHILNHQITTLIQADIIYEKQLQDMEECLENIIKDTRLYDEMRQQIEGIYPQADISFLEVFSEKDSPYFQQHINAYLTYFKDDSNFTAKTIQLARTKLDIELLEVDQRIQSTVFAVGIGSGAATIAGASYAVTDEGTKYKLFYKDNFYVNATYAQYLLVGFIISILAGLMAWYFHCRKKRQQNKVKSQRSKIKVF